MATFEKCDKSVLSLAVQILNAHETHRPVLNAGVRVDYLFAYPKYDEKGNPVGDALKKNGVKALGITRKCSLKERAKGHGDAEICIDGEWWKSADELEQTALLDHELHHISVEVNQAGVFKKDDLDRPVIRLRKHDVEIGWFDVVAQRNGIHSQERKQARYLIEARGQLYWPEVSAVNRKESRVAHLEQRVSTSA